MRHIPDCWTGSAATSRSPRLPERAWWPLTSTDDPVAAFLAAHAAGEPVALATSGSAGPVRSVVRSTGSWVSSFPSVTRLAGMHPTSRVWVPGPLTSTMNLFAAVHASMTGVATATGPDQATHAVLTPTALSALLDAELPSGLVVVVAGDRLSPGLHDRAVAAGATVHHYYGAAELSFVAWGTHAGDLRPFPAVRVRVVDGEIRVRSPYLCSGYDGPPGALRHDQEGFTTVGDRGAFVGGRLVVHGRDDAVSTGGTTVSVADIEPVLREAAIGDVIVVGVQHIALGAVVAGVLTSRADHPVVREVARARLAGALRPRLWFHVEALPLTAAGKVDRAALVSLLSTGDSSARRLV